MHKLEHLIVHLHLDYSTLFWSRLSPDFWNSIFPLGKIRW